MRFISDKSIVDSSNEERNYLERAAIGNDSRVEKRSLRWRARTDLEIPSRSYLRGRATTSGRAIEKLIVTFASARHSLDVRFLDRSAKVTHSGGRLGSRYPIGRRDRPRSRCRQEKRKRETVIRNSTRTTFTITISDRVCRLRRNENRNLGVLVCITRRIVPLLTICAICVRVVVQRVETLRSISAKSTRYGANEVS